MLLRKKLNKVKKQISQKDEIVFDGNDNALITIKAMEEQQIFSTYDYDCNEKLNEELASYIWDKAKFVPAKNDIRIKMYVDDKVNESEVQNAVYNKFKKEYIESKMQKKRNFLFSMVMFFVGLLALAVLFLSYSFFPNAYVDVILEIVVWVFLWEAVDAFFLERSQINHKQLVLLKLCSADVQIVKAKKKVSKNKVL